MPSTADGHLPYRECVRAARAVRAAQFGREALETIRPRGVTGVIRTRAPLSLVLYTAALDRRVVWQGPGGFALLEPPMVGPRGWQPKGVRLGLLSWIDRNWGTVQFGLPPMVVLLVALGMAAVPRLRLAALLLVLVAMVYVTGLLLTMAVRQFFVGHRRASERAALANASSEHWSMPLLHQETEARIEEILNQVQTRLHRLIRDRASQLVADLGGQVDGLRMSETLVCLHGGVTSQACRSRVESARNVVLPFGTGSSFSLRMFDARPGDLAQQPVRPQAFFRFYVFSVVVVFLGITFLVMVNERNECRAEQCERALTSYERALWWLSYQLIWRDVPQLKPASGFAIAMGWLFAFLLPVVVLVGVEASRRLNRARKAVLVTIERRRRDLMGNTRVLIVTVADVERDAVLDAIEHITGKTVAPRYDRSVPVFAMGAVNDTELLVVQAGAQGLNNTAGTTRVTAEAIRHVAPDYALIVGICYGLRKESQAVGDILVSERIQDIDHAKLVDGDTRVEQQDRGENVVPSDLLLNACRAAQRTWSKISTVPVRFGPMLAWNKLLNSHLTVEDLRQRYPNAIGGDMEGAGFHASARGAGVEPILIKSICDWGADKNKTAQRQAARNAAEFVVHLVITGALAHDPASRRSG